MSALDHSHRLISGALEIHQPDFIISMVSGGKDSAASHAVAVELGVKIDLVIHGNTRCGIPETSQFVEAHYGQGPWDFAVADAGTSYEDYVLRKGFFGAGIDAHGYAYRILKAGPFRKVISAKLRQRKRGIKILLLNGARKDESENRRKHLKMMRPDPAAPGNVWVNIIHTWTQEDRDTYLQDRNVPINPVAKALCRSGECMCGTMQSKQERAEAAALYPKWGNWLTSLETEVRAKHGFGWGETFPRKPDPRQIDMFQPMCSDCVRNAA
jgi:3'-phosphoadenosine 5'-phosphosulfate sulfotransferase (PAPS reductase)/FAD synthetase